MKNVDALEEALSVAGDETHNALIEGLKERLQSSALEFATTGSPYLLMDDITRLQKALTLRQRSSDADAAVAHDEIRRQFDVMALAFNRIMLASVRRNAWRVHMNGILVSGVDAATAALKADLALAEEEARFGKLPDACAAEQDGES